MSKKRKYNSTFEMYQDDKDWNFVIDYFKICAQMIRTCDEASITGDVVLYYRCLKAFFRDIKDIVRMRNFSDGDKTYTVGEKTWNSYKEWMDDIQSRFSEIREQLKSGDGVPSSMARKVEYLLVGKVEVDLDTLHMELLAAIHDSYVILPQGFDNDWENEEAMAYT